MVGRHRFIAHHISSGAIVTAILVTGTTKPSSAQSLAGLDAGRTVIATMIPRAPHSAPPNWVKPGLRLTYSIGVASARGEGKIWTFPEHGKPIPEDKYSVGGNGYLQNDIVAISGGQVAIVQSHYLTNLQEPMTLLSREGGVAPLGTGVDLWVNPSLLSGLRDGMHANTQVYRAPFKAGGATRPGVWMQERTRSGATLAIYDRETGAMLHYTSETTHKPTGQLGPNEYSNTTNKMIFRITLADRRQIVLPWSASSVSEWASHPVAMTYRGMSSTGSGTGVGTPVREAASATFSPKQHGANWISYTMLAKVGPNSAEVPFVCGAAQIGSVWIPPAALAELRPGQELDRDPITKTVVRVGGSGRSRESGSSIVISESAPGYEIDYVYDRTSGELAAMNKIERHPYVVKQLQLALQTRR